MLPSCGSHDESLVFTEQERPREGLSQGSAKKLPKIQPRHQLPDALSLYDEEKLIFSLFMTKFLHINFWFGRFQQCVAFLAPSLSQLH